MYPGHRHGANSRDFPFGPDWRNIPRCRSWRAQRPAAYVTTAAGWVKTKPWEGCNMSDDDPRPPEGLAADRIAKKRPTGQSPELNDLDWVLTDRQISSFRRSGPPWGGPGSARRGRFTWWLGRRMIYRNKIATACLDVASRYALSRPRRPPARRRGPPTDARRSTPSRAAPAILPGPANDYLAC